MPRKSFSNQSATGNLKILIYSIETLDVAENRVNGEKVEFGYFIYVITFVLQLKIDLGEQYKLQQIVTQGTGESTSDDKYVISYKVMYKQHHDAPWKPVRDGKGKEEKVKQFHPEQTLLFTTLL